MKRVLLIILLSLFSFSSIASVVKIDIKKTISSNPNPKPRSGATSPKVEVDTDMCLLTISMVASESYTVYVCDSRGTVVYQGSVATDGGRQVYLLPELEADLYSISIEGNSATYDGEFYAN